MASKDRKTQKWLGKLRELMDWFLNVDTIHSDNLMEAHCKGLAVNYLAAKLGILDPPPPPDPIIYLERELPYRMNDWQCDIPGLPGTEERKQWRLERMTYWRARAEERAAFQTVSWSPEATPFKVYQYCDRLQSIIYRAGSWDSSDELFALGRHANDLAVELGLTHPDWLLALELSILPHFVNTKEIRDLPLPWDYDMPPVMLGNSPIPVEDSAVPGLRQAIKKAEALLAKAGDDTREGSSDVPPIPPEHRSAPLSLKRMAELFGGDMTAKKLKAMIDNDRLHVAYRCQSWL